MHLILNLSLPLLPDEMTALKRPRQEIRIRQLACPLDHLSGLNLSSPEAVSMMERAVGWAKDCRAIAGPTEITVIVPDGFRQRPQRRFMRELDLDANHVWTRSQVAAPVSPVLTGPVP